MFLTKICLTYYSTTFSKPKESWWKDKSNMLLLSQKMEIIAGNRHTGTMKLRKRSKRDHSGRVLSLT